MADFSKLIEVIKKRNSDNYDDVSALLKELKDMKLTQITILDEAFALIYERIKQKHAELKSEFEKLPFKKEIQSGKATTR